MFPLVEYTDLKLAGSVLKMIHTGENTMHNFNYFLCYRITDNISAPDRTQCSLSLRAWW